MSDDYLGDLWRLIKDHRNLMIGEYTGLRVCDFDMPRHVFEDVYNSRINQHLVKHTLIFGSVEKALDELVNANISFHHLTCAADTDLLRNNALCIHYDLNDSVNRSLALPGVTYVPTEKTFVVFRTIFKKFDLNFEAYKKK
ncbi:hypothetical protein KO361_00820 [Candidatus Woesearchaeota archaeon]|nr:hypothetical protein [Candidatus Woesearchaeota archaeon]